MGDIFTAKQQELIKRCIQDIMKRVDAQNRKTKELQRMAHLARTGQKESEEFKILEMKHRHPTVIDYGNPIMELNELGLKKGKSWKND